MAGPAQIVPSHMRDFQLGIVRFDRNDSPAIQPSPGVSPCSSPRSASNCMPTQMPRNGAPRYERLRSRASTMPSIARRPRRQSARRRRRAARSGRPANLFRVGGDGDRRLDAAFARGPLESLGRRMQVAGSVINDGDVQDQDSRAGNRPKRSASAPNPDVGGARSLLAGRAAAQESAPRRAGRNRRVRLRARSRRGPVHASGSPLWHRRPWRKRSASRPNASAPTP